MSHLLETREEVKLPFLNFKNLSTKALFVNADEAQSWLRIIRNRFLIVFSKFK